jgi:hypothetical protein
MNGVINRSRGEATMLLSEARVFLTRVWLLGTAAPTLLLVTQSILGKYPDSVREVWSWYFPLVAPTIALMIGIQGGAAFGGRDRVVRRSFYEITLWLSVAYLAIISITIILEPFSALRGMALYGVSTYWLAPLQGLVVGALGYLFTSETPDNKKKAKAPAKGKETADTPEKEKAENPGRDA